VINEGDLKPGDALLPEKALSLSQGLRRVFAVTGDVSLVARARRWIFIGPATPGARQRYFAHQRASVGDKWERRPC